VSWQDALEEAQEETAVESTETLKANFLCVAARPVAVAVITETTSVIG
jgi:hypothetical protein